MSSMRRVLIVASIVFMASGFVYSVKAFGMDEANWPTQITFVEPLQVGGLSLSPGTYDFYLASGPAARNVVMIYNVDKRRWEGMAMGVNDERQDTSRRTGFTFIEPKNGDAKMLQYWFYPGWNRGVKFVYPESQTGTMAASITAAK